jgi:hypothetical protein
MRTVPVLVFTQALMLAVVGAARAVVAVKSNAASTLKRFIETS